MIPLILADQDIIKWLEDDIPFWDITTTLIPDKNSNAKIFARQKGIIAGIPFAQRVFELLGAEFLPKVAEGSFIEKKKVIAEVKGNLHALLQAERLSLNILGRLSGIATLTFDYKSKISKLNPKLRICATRKVLPGWGKYDKYAIVLGGGDTHRLSLSDMVLLKENHLRFFNSVSEAIRITKTKTSFSKKVEIEVQNESQAIEAAKSKADIIMLDNFSPQQVKLVIKKIREINENVLIEISGNINFDNIENYSLEDVDLISSGALTHSVKNFNIAMLID